MAASKVDVRKVLSRLDAQLAGMAERPDLVEGLPYGPDPIGAGLTRTRTLMARQARAKKTVVTLTAMIRGLALELREQFNANVGVVRARRGRDSMDVAVLGGAVRKGRAAGTDAESAPAAATAPSVAAPPSATGSGA